MESSFSQVGEKVLQSARNRGLTGEVFIIKGRELSIEVRNGEVETLKQAEESGMGIRIIDRGRLGFTFTTDLSPQAAEQAVGDAARQAGYSAGDKPYEIPDGQGVSYATLPLFDPTIGRASLDDKIGLARDLETKARELDKRVARLDSSAYQETEYSVLLMNTRDIYAFKKVNLCGVNVSLVAEAGDDVQSGFAFMVRRRFDELDTSSIAREAVEGAVDLLGGQPLATGQMPCVMDPYVVTRFLAVLAQMLDADAVFKGRSLLKGCLGEDVFSPLLTIVDDSLLENGIGSTPFDSEGMPGQKTTLVDKGVLRSYLADYLTAVRENCPATGSARRASFRSLPSVGSSNLILQPGPMKPGEMLKAVGRGFYITDVMGMHMVNPVSGQFSVGAAGRLIEGGELTRAVRGVTIAGNLKELFRNVEAVGSDLKFYGGRAAPSLWLSHLSVAGQ